MRSSVLDLGSNSFHVLVADIDGRVLTPVMRAREMLHLGRVVARHGIVPPENLDLAVATVAHLSELARRSGAARELAVATSALRDARNGPEVIERLSQAAGIPVTVLDGLTEARLSYLGVRAAVAVDTEPVLVLDLGGGSLELAIGIGDRVIWSATAPIGISRLSALIDDDPITAGQVQLLTDRVDQELSALTQDVATHAPMTTVAVGGTVRALARIAAAEATVWLPATLNMLPVTRDRIATIRDELIERDLDGRLQVPGMKSRRADHLHIAAIVLTRILQQIGSDQITISDWGLREGLLLDAYGAHGSPWGTGTPSALELRKQEVDRVRRTFSPDDPHPAHVARLAAKLFQATRDLHQLSDEDGELLEHAATLHAIGESVALRRQHQHGAYLVENAELRGFNPTSSALLNTLVRFHPSRGISSKHPPFASLNPQDQQRALRLLALLQVADGLDRAHDQAVTGLDVSIEDRVVQLRLTGGGLHVTPDELARKVRTFACVFDVDVQVRDDGS